MIRLWVAFVLLVALSAMQAGCDRKPKGPGGEIWKEEVRLMNGDLIIVDRRNVYGSSGDLSASHGPLTEAEIRFDYKGKKYDWRQRAVWPMAIQEDPQGRIYVVSTIPYCWAWDELGQPDSYYVVHRFENGLWDKVHVSEIDPDTVFNLAGSSSSHSSEKFRDFVSESDWKFKNSTYEPDRHIMPGIGAGCLR